MMLQCLKWTLEALCLGLNLDQQDCRCHQRYLALEWTEIGVHSASCCPLNGRRRQNVLHDLQGSGLLTHSTTGLDGRIYGYVVPGYWHRHESVWLRYKCNPELPCCLSRRLQHPAEGLVLLRFCCHTIPHIVWQRASLAFPITNPKLLFPAASVTLRYVTAAKALVNA